MRDKIDVFKLNQKIVHTKLIAVVSKFDMIFDLADFKHDTKNRLQKLFAETTNNGII